MIIFRYTAWNRGIGMLLGIWKPWRQVEIISRAVRSITANGLGFQHTGVIVILPLIFASAYTMRETRRVAAAAVTALPSTRVKRSRLAAQPIVQISPSSESLYCTHRTFLHIQLHWSSNNTFWGAPILAADLTFSRANNLAMPYSDK